GKAVHMCYAFEFLEAEPLSAARMAEVFAQLDEVAAEGWACWAFSNHDVMRHASRWGLSPAAQRLYITLLMCLRGSACLYQGEELGLPEADVPFEAIQDPYGVEFWPEFKGRDGCRTPMVWTLDNQNGGFSAAEPWLPVSSAHLGLAVSEQEGRPDALLLHYRLAIAFRRANEVLAKGAMLGAEADGSVFRFIRSGRSGSGAEQTMFCAFNLSDDQAVIKAPDGAWVQTGPDLNAAALQDDGTITLEPWQPVLLHKA
ncbi:MAG: alpha-amylase family glycosyl hydrolase, partial [Pseudomonadota bacterium]